MIDFKRMRLVWSVVALVASCVLGVASYEFVAKQLIISAETQRLSVWVLDGKPQDGRHYESAIVMTDGRMAEGAGSWNGPTDGQALLDLVIDSLDKGSVSGGWVYLAVPARLESGNASGWIVSRASIGAALGKAVLVTVGGILFLWAAFVALLHLLYFKVRRSIASFVAESTSRLGVVADTGRADVGESLQAFEVAVRERFTEIEERLRDAVLLSRVAKGTENGVFVCDAQGRVIWANRGLANLIGCGPEELIGCSPADCFKSSDNDPLQLAMLGSAFARGKGARIEGVVDCDHGKQIWASLELQPVANPAGEVDRFFGILIDITEQRRVSDKFEEISRRFTLAMESSHIGVWEWNVKRDQLLWDERTLALYGISERDFGTDFRSWMNCLDPDYRNRASRVVEQALADKSDIELVAKVSRPDGKEVYVQQMGRAYRNESGDVIRYLGIVTDVTAQHLAERDLIEQKEEAENLAVRLAEAVKQSKKAAAEAHQATRAKSAFLAMMSHEIRTPMNGVIGMASLLLETELDEYQRDYLNTIRVSGDTLLSLINDILDYSKIESGKLDIERAPFSVRECVEDALDLLASKASEKDLELICRINVDTPKNVVGDITRLRQILVNLVGNAIKFTDIGEIEVCVHAPKENHIKFSVRDTGIGIPEDRMHRLFEVFSQVDSSTTRKYGGSGLGLSISKQLTELMGGEMWVESSVGKGSVFHFTIEVPELESAQRDPLFETQPKLKGQRMVIAEPNFVLRDYLRSLAEAWGMEAVSVSSFEHLAGMEAAKRGFDIVVAGGSQQGLSQESREQMDTVCGKAKSILWLLPHGTPARRGEREQTVFKPCRVSALLDAIKLGCVESPSKHEVVNAKGSAVDDALAQRLPLRILVADDNSVNQKVARMMLKKFGYGCDLVANGVEAVEAVKQREYDLIFMDCQMPEMDGFEATRMIRALEADRSASRATFIFALTANVREESHDLSKQVGMNGFLAKPIKLGDIRQALDEVGNEMVSRN